MLITAETTQSVTLYFQFNQHHLGRGDRLLVPALAQANDCHGGPWSHGPRRPRAGQGQECPADAEHVGRVQGPRVHGGN